MPYAPGVQDISGQLRAQGIAQAGQAWSQAIGNIGKDLGDAFQTYKQNQFITNQALGKFAGATQSDPSMLRFLESGGTEQEDPNAPKANVSPEVLKAYSNAKSGKIGMNDAAVLSAFSDSWQKNKADQVQRQHIALQNQILGQQIDQANRMSEFMKQYLRPQGTSGAATGAVTPSVGTGAGSAPTGAPTERDVVAKAIATTGKIPSQAQITAQLRLDTMEWRKNQIESKEYGSDAEAAQAVKNMAATGAFAPGTTGVVKKNPATGSFYIETATTSFEPTEQAAARAGAIKGAESQAASIGKIADKDIAASEAAQQIAYPVDRLLNLIESGQLKTGVGEEFKNQARAVAKAFNLPVNEEKLAAGNEAIAYMGQLLLPIYQVQKGTVSNSEQELYKSMTAGMAKGTKANEALLRVMSERINVDRKLGNLAEDYSSGDLDKGDYIKRRKAIREEFDAKVKTMAKEGGIPIGPDSNEVRLTVSQNPDGTITAGKASKYTPGTRVTQGGVTYEYDGTNWNEVK